MFGVETFSAVINPPQGAILTVGNKKDIPTKTQDGRLKNEGYLTVQLCFHAGAIESDQSAKFLDTLKKIDGKSIHINIGKRILRVLSYLTNIN